ncbi:MAG: hypothetical protein U0572_15410 [Phycisphaerales bacterium]
MRTHLIASLALTLAASPIAAAAFVAGDIYLVSASLVDAPGGGMPGIYHFSPPNVSGEVFKLLPAGSFGPGTGVSNPQTATYDPFRGKIMVPAAFGLIGTVDSAGTLGTISAPNVEVQAFLAPGPGGIVYALTGVTARYLDANNVVHPLLDVGGGAQVNVLGTGMHTLNSIIYDASTNSLIALGQFNDQTGIVRVPLNAAGTQAAGPLVFVHNDLVPGIGENPVGISAGPSGSIFVAYDVNGGGAMPLLQTVNPTTLVATTFAVTSGFNNAAETTGSWTPSLGASGGAVVLDSLLDVLRAYSFGASGPGTIVASGASAPSWAGESSRSLTIGGTLNGSVAVPGDLNGDGHVNAADLSILLGAWGPCGNCSGCVADFDHDCDVDAADLSVLLGYWGT